MQIAEVSSVAYDSISNVAIAAAQDTGVSTETAEGSTVWNETTKSAGGTVAVDDASLAASNQSYRYTAGTYLSNFQQQTYDAGNNLVAGSTVSPGVEGHRDHEDLRPGRRRPIRHPDRHQRGQSVADRDRRGHVGL